MWILQENVKVMGCGIGGGCAILIMEKFTWEVFKMCVCLCVCIYIYVCLTRHDCFSSVQFSCSVVTLSDPMDCSMKSLPVHHQLPEFTQTPLSQWCPPTISPSVVPFSSHLQSFPPSGSFQMSQFFISGGQSIGVSALALPMNIQDWFPLGWTGWISLKCKGLSRVFSNTTVQKHQFFGTQFSLESKSHIHTQPLEKL